ncbi:hypothetical protein ACFSJ3_15980 [Corallincola platygyrae]|uniref:Uncharacterized protein n=1 Tax=Corallincola platygyrae TaxID=1193278 RepID=A0ABW4XRN0_9GAMM
MKLKLTRDSVAAGDDADAPHFFDVVVSDDSTTEEIIEFVCEGSYLPKVVGSATWSFSSHKPLAVFAQKWGRPRMLSFIDCPVSDLATDGSGIRFHVNYHAQIEPEVVFEVLRRTKPNAI